RTEARAPRRLPWDRGRVPSGPGNLREPGADLRVRVGDLSRRPKGPDGPGRAPERGTRDPGGGDRLRARGRAQDRDGDLHDPDDLREPAARSRRAGGDGPRLEGKG